MCVCVCVCVERVACGECACVRACMRACVHVCVCVHDNNQIMKYQYCSSLLCVSVFMCVRYVIYDSEFLGLLKALKWPVTTTIELSKSSWDTHQQKMTHLITVMVRMEEEGDSIKSIK